MKRRNFAFALMFLVSLFTMSCGATVGEKEIIKITKDVAKDATYELFTKLVDGSYPNGVEITFEKGEYHFYPEKALEQFCYISNHNDVLSKIAFPINGMKNVTINGNGSEFIFHGRIIPFWIEDSENVNIKNLSIDFAESFHSELLVVENNTKKKYIDFKIAPEYPYEIRNDQLIFVKSYYEHNLGYSITYDPTTESVAYLADGIQIDSRGTQASYGKVELAEDLNLNDEYARRRGKEYSIKVEELEPGLVRVHNLKKPLKEGLLLICKGENGMNRFAPAMKGCNSTNVIAENVTVYHAGGMGFLFENCENLEFKGCKVEPSQGRMVSTTADASHFVGCRGTLALRDCSFRNQLDDASNIHGAYQRVVDVLDENSLGVRMGHYQQAGFALAKPGDKVGIVRLSESFEPYATLTVKSVDFINGRYNRVVFNEELPERVSSEDMLENLSAYPELIIDGCTFKSNRARGILISTPVKTTITNTFFNTQMSALFIPVESGAWHESGSGANIVIENNIFQDCGFGGKAKGVILFETDDDTDNVAFKNVRVANNTFNHFDNLILELANIDGFVFEGNTITNSGTFPQVNAHEPFATIKHCKNVNFANNKYKGKATEMIKSIDGKPAVKFN